MPSVRHPAVLRAVYNETLRLIRAWQMPNLLLTSETTLYHYADSRYLTPTTRGFFPRQQANNCLRIRDEFQDANRFSGQSLNSDVPSCGALYCSPQQQALMNEILHYARSETRIDAKTQRKVTVPITRDPQTGFPNAHAALNRRFVLKIRLSTSFLVADISPHNPAALQFIATLGRADSIQAAYRLAHVTPKPLWDELCDSDDCSVARGIGLAVASTPAYSGIQAQTVRLSGRGGGETGDNVILFGHDNQLVPGLWVEEIYFFPIQGEIQVYDVQA